MKFVIDCSIAIAFFFKDERTEKIDKLFESIKKSNDIEIFVPSIFYSEFLNVMLIGERRKRTNYETIKKSLKIIKEFNLVQENFEGYELKVLDLAKKYDLSIYDASYLELAVRKNIPLISQDKKLIKATKKCGLLSEV